MSPLTSRFDEAFFYAAEVHRLQTRKSSRIPYLAHLMSVAALVVENGGDEEQAIAALLHDAPEDQGGEVVLREIEERFGPGVARLVGECSEPLEYGKREWHVRKRLYLGHLCQISERAVLIVCADKLHNVRSILAELPEKGLAIFDRFGGGLDGSLWYYAELARVLSHRGPRPLRDELREAVDRMLAACAVSGAS